MSVRRRDRASSYTLTVDDARIVKGMLLRGDKQHDVAAYFGVNGGRIADIATGARHVFAKPAQPRYLPPPGPYAVKDLVGDLRLIGELLARGMVSEATKVANLRLNGGGER